MSFNLYFSSQVQTYSKTILEKSVPEIVGPVSELRIAHCLAVEDLLRIEGNKFVSVRMFPISLWEENRYDEIDDFFIGIL